MNSGVLYGHAFMVDGLISEIQNSLGASCISAAATGGLAGLVLPCCKSEIEHVPFLTLLGLRLIYEKNMK